MGARPFCTPSRPDEKIKAMDSFEKKVETRMTNEEKEKLIRPWIDPEERVTVHFLDAPDLNAEILSCTRQIVDLSIETRVPHMQQHLAVPLSKVKVSKDGSHYTRDPERSLQPSRLMLVIDGTRPPIIY